MRTQKSILVAFVLNLAFSLFELVGGVLTGSAAILSDAVHDIGDAASIGISFLLEKKSRKQPDTIYTYGYARYSVMGSVITTLILLVGSMLVIFNAANRILHPVSIDYNGMILFALVGVCVNFGGAYFTRDGASLNQKAVNLHMLEDVLGWAVVLLGAVAMRLTHVSIIDPLMSVGVAVFILIHAVRNLRECMELFLEKIPRGLDVEQIKAHVTEVDGVLDVHHIHVWSLDGQNNCATMHIVTDADPHRIKAAVRSELMGHGIGHVTLELEREGECCHEVHCHVEFEQANAHHHHH